MDTSRTQACPAVVKVRMHQFWCYRGTTRTGCAFPSYVAPTGRRTGSASGMFLEAL